MTQNIRGAGLMIASMILFAINDAFLKELGDSLPIFQTLTLRSVLTLGLLMVFTWRTGWLARGLAWGDYGALLLRLIAEIGAAFFIISALFNMELANMTAILQVLPLTIPMAAWLFLLEPLGWRRMLAIGVGFLGMLLIVQPGSDGFSIYSLYCIGAVICVTVRDIVGRKLTGKVSSQKLSLYAAAGVFGFASVSSLFEQWQAVSVASWGMLVGSSIFIMIGSIISVKVMRTGDVSFTAQFRYVGLIAALTLGYLFFDEWPNALTMIGAVVVVCTGLFTLYRERVVKNT